MQCINLTQGQSPFKVSVTFTDFGFLFKPFDFFHEETFKSFGHAWCWLFQKRVVRTKLDIYVFITEK